MSSLLKKKMLYLNSPWVLMFSWVRTKVGEWAREGNLEGLNLDFIR